MSSSPIPELTIRRAEARDHDDVWRIFHEVVRAGDTYVFPPDTAREEALRLWMPNGGHTFVAEREGRIVATYLLKANQAGLGDHIANAGYMVSAEAAGHGIGRALCVHSMDVARGLGFTAMQFNFVVSTNTRAVALWQRCGFAIVGTVPRAFRHRELGPVDVFVMHREL